ncbi:MAG: transglutaminase [Desulfuromonas sp.]|nr:MAG: transglutaminase [Desulfuromonas sp.]
MTANQTKMLQLADERYGKTGIYAVNSWLRLQNECASLPIDQQLDRVNSFFNERTRYVDDRLTWGQDDYWATPLETLGMGQGDCEDFSFAKYVTLHLLGVPVEKLRLTYVRARLTTIDGIRNQAHMVLSYYPTPDSPPLILDSLRSEIMPASQRSDLFPIFSFNTENLWTNGAAAPAGNAVTRLSHWRDVLRRMHEEGVN